MSEKKFKLQQLLDWCDEKASEGSELTIKWDGGGDSGWVYFEVDDVQCDEPEAEALVDMMYDLLDYGSWAGEFSANGEAKYDPTDKTFTGYDYYSESEDTKCKANIEIRIPKAIPFTMLNIQTEGEDTDVTTDLFITNGFVHPEYEKIQNELNESLKEKFSDAINKDLEITGQDFDSSWHNYEILRTEFTVDGDDMVCVIDTVHYTFHNTTDKHMCIDLAELLKEEEEESGL